MERLWHGSGHAGQSGQLAELGWWGSSSSCDMHTPIRHGLCPPARMLSPPGSQGRRKAITHKCSTRVHILYFTVNSALLSLGGSSRTPQMRWRVRQMLAFHSLEAGSLRSGAAWWLPGRGPLLYVHVVGAEQGALWGLPYKGSDPETSPPRSSH